MPNENPTHPGGGLTRRAMLQRSTLGVAGLSAAAVLGRGASARAATPAAKSGAANAAVDYAKDPAWLKAKYGPWGGPGVRAAPGPMDGILARDYAPVDSLVLEETFVPKARFPAIDAHVHHNARTPADVNDWVRTMDEVGIEISVVLTGATGEAFNKLVDLYLKPHPKRFQLYCGLLTTDIEAPDYPARTVAELVRCHGLGARGVGELSDKGMGFAPGVAARPKRLHPDDPRLDRFWQKCAELKLPINMHVADHPSCWKPLDVYQERPPQYQHFNLYGKDVPSFEELIAARDRMLARHPQTTVVACHLGNQGHHLAELGRTLDRYPNLHLDISARDYEVGRTPRAATRFLQKYPDRVLFGTDMGREKSMYQAWWRLFETADECMPSRQWWRYYGLQLSAPLLESLYRGNARRLLNWEKV
jgi:uncharacterized protein